MPGNSRSRRRGGKHNRKQTVRRPTSKEVGLFRELFRPTLCFRDTGLGKLGEASVSGKVETVV